MFSCVQRYCKCGERKSKTPFVNPPTDIEIKKIQQNLDNLIAFNQTSHDLSFPVINEVQNMLKSVTPTKDEGLQNFSSLLSFAFEQIGNLEFEGASLISKFLSGLLISYNTNTPPNLSEDFGLMSQRYTVTTQQIYNDLTLYRENVIKYIDTPLPVPFGDKTQITLRDLIKETIPSSDDHNFALAAQSHTRGLRSSVCKQELPKTDTWQMVYVAYYDGCGYVPPNILEVLYPFGYLTDTPPLSIANDELWVDKPDIPRVLIQSDDTSYSSFISLVLPYLKQQPQSFIVPWQQKDNIFYYGKYVLMESFSEFRDWTLATPEFCNWLFIDDGFGNIMNPDACGLREDVIRNWGLRNGDKIPKVVPNDLPKEGEKIMTFHKIKVEMAQMKIDMQQKK
jgi:hypothetical protein